MAHFRKVACSERAGAILATMVTFEKGGLKDPNQYIASAHFARLARSRDWRRITASYQVYGQLPRLERSLTKAVNTAKLHDGGGSGSIASDVDRDRRIRDDFSVSYSHFCLPRSAASLRGYSAVLRRQQQSLAARVSEITQPSGISPVHLTRDYVSIESSQISAEGPSVSSNN